MAEKEAEEFAKTNQRGEVLKFNLWPRFKMEKCIKIKYNRKTISSIYANFIFFIFIKFCGIIYTVFVCFGYHIKWYCTSGQRV